MQLVEPGTCPVVVASVDGPSDLDALADELEEVLAREERFALELTGPSTLESLERLLWSAPTARRRFRRQRPALAAWCDKAAFVGAQLTADEMRRAELIWGCRVVSA
jgi:hypothetical protein